MTYHRIRPELAHLTIDIDSIRPNPDNPNSGDVDIVAESLALNGQYLPILVDTETRTILAGHTRWTAALSLGWTHIAAVLLTTEGWEGARILLADNRTGQRARMDEGLLLAALGALPDLSGTGYDRDDVSRLERLVSAPLVFPEVRVAECCPLCGK